MKRLFKIALTVSLSSVVFIFSSSNERNILKAETFYRKPLSNQMQKASPSESKVLALYSSSVERFGDDFLLAWKAGKSSDFIPNKVELDRFLYSAFGSEYTNLSTRDKNYVKFSLYDALKALHTNPLLIDSYKKMIFTKRGVSQDGNSYIYRFNSQIVGKPIRDGAIRIKEVEGNLQIVDIKSNYWLAGFLGEQYSKIRNTTKVPIVQFMDSFGKSIKRQWGS